MLKYILTFSWRTRLKRAKKEIPGEREGMVKEKRRGDKEITL